MYKRNQRMSIKQATQTHYKCLLDIPIRKSTQKQRAFYTDSVFAGSSFIWPYAESQLKMER